jgi:hypothetical protein
LSRDKVRANSTNPVLSVTLRMARRIFGIGPSSIF